MRTHSIDGHLPEFAMQKAPIISTIKSVFCLRLELSGRIIGASAHRRIGASAHRRIGRSTYGFLHSHSLTSGARPIISHRLVDGPIPVSGWDGLTRWELNSVTRDVTVSGALGPLESMSRGNPSDYTPTGKVEELSCAVLRS